MDDQSQEPITLNLGPFTVTVAHNANHEIDWDFGPPLHSTESVAHIIKRLWNNASADERARLSTERETILDQYMPDKLRTD